MFNPSSTGAAPAPESWAEVRARDTVIRYRRTGVGRAVLLLESERHRLWPELIDSVRSEIRLIIPEMPPSDADVAAWLSDFLEGLGVAGISVLASDSQALPILELALQQTGLIADVVLVSDQKTPRDEWRGVMEGTLRGSRVRLLVVRTSQPLAEAADSVSRFLRGE